MNLNPTYFHDQQQVSINFLIVSSIIYNQSYYCYKLSEWILCFICLKILVVIFWRTLETASEVWKRSAYILGYKNREQTTAQWITLNVKTANRLGNWKEKHIHNM